jgi:hypothetical protein
LKSTGARTLAFTLSGGHSPANAVDMDVAEPRRRPALLLRARIDGGADGRGSVPLGLGKQHLE